MSAFDAADHAFMARALQLAAQGLASAHPNPRVGCVLVRDGAVLAEGWHEHAGGPHAEAAALANLRAPGAGATAYVTLEPCNHHGRTPPCSEALIKAGVVRVVYAVGDPNPLVNGAGARRLREAGVQVQSGLLEADAVELNAGFIKRMREGLPLVRLKLAMSLDGRTALSDGRSKWISGEAARQDVQRWRARSSAILTGIGTVLADDPLLSVRPAGPAVRQPLRVILDNQLRTPPGARVFADTAERGVWIFTASDDHERMRALEARGARVERIGEAAPLDPAQVLGVLGKAGINEVLVEAGATLAGALVDRQCVDELLLYVAPVVLGDRARGLLRLPEPQSLEQARRFEIFETLTLGQDQRLRLRRVPQ
ncbi:MAG TPA: bifunctional diaminohydroxyphosphoribosylaminopyrimidine deaminase/5-amino-6-(5-phosphoribosylamino)uracil reductase RibD [Steroidobacteraceae bacterium]|nr:bifunctional diaminohydroxyphosphoribosylaminopyrimidine deaminase/5-amino-6-(5-phosphoribosylamino)uracil reductase RibD [Steroidobacteraceae bacterium]